jgi:DNA ligase-1
MPSTFQSLSEVLEKVEATKKRLEIIEQTANYLKTLSAEEIEPAVNMMIGRAFPNYSQKTLDVSWTTLTRVFDHISQFDWNLFRQAMVSTGDIGSATKTVLEQSNPKKQTQLTQKSLTIMEVKRMFVSISQAQGSRVRIKRERLIAALLSQATPGEAKYLVKIFTGEMRTGLHEGLMGQAVALAFSVPLKKVQHAAMVFGDIGEVAATLKNQGEQGIEKADFKIFHPVKLMLAQTAQTVEEALTEHGGKTAFEYKYDGARVQIHKQIDVVRVFSRRLTDVTESLPEIVGFVKRNFKAQSVIVEGK